MCLLSCGNRCSYEDTLGPGADCSHWITHVNHLGEELGADYVWYRNPDPRLGPVEPDWESIVYQVLNALHSYTGQGTMPMCWRRRHFEVNTHTHLRISGFLELDKSRLSFPPHPP